MARFHDYVGYEEEPREDPTSPGNYLPSRMVERRHFGTVLKHSRKWDNPVNVSVNDDLNVTNRISIVADAYMTDHWPAIRYVRLGGENWKVASIDVERPRLILNLGGVWNGPTGSAA